MQPTRRTRKRQRRLREGSQAAGLPAAQEGKGQEGEEEAGREKKRGVGGGKDFEPLFISVRFKSEGEQEEGEEDQTGNPSSAQKSPHTTGTTPSSSTASIATTGPAEGVDWSNPLVQPPKVVRGKK